MSETKYYIGLMSGTSIDSIDAALVTISDNKTHLIGSHSEDIPSTLKNNLLALCSPGTDEITRMGSADYQLGKLFAKATNTLLAKNQLVSKDVCAIGSHGQTIRHLPETSTPFTLQIGNPSIISHDTGICTVADFRRSDMAAGGQGAPLAPAFHQAAFSHPQKHRVIVNIGGIANITSLNPLKPAFGFDTGPGNCLLDYWAQQHIKQSFDTNGKWGASGKTIPALLEKCLADPYFQRRPPKSTGREHFNPAWLNMQLNDEKYLPVDIQATLTALTALSISNEVKALKGPIDEVFICGGGAHNSAVIDSIQSELASIPVTSTKPLGIAADWVEAAAFAWLAHQTLNNRPANLPSVTGANKACILGAIYPV